MPIKIVNIYSNDNEKSLSIRNSLETKLRGHGFGISYDMTKSAELNICIGGDGAFLRAVHSSNLSQVPFVGVNTGHLGFYQEIMISELDSFIRSFLEGDYLTTKLSLISGKIVTSNSVKTFYALNEFVIKSDSNSIVHLKVSIDDYHLEHFAGDGLIISTPSGSTAYNFSVGGSILYQTLDGFQMAPIAPINSRAYRSLLNSVVMPKTTVLKLYPTRNDNDGLAVLVDGVQLNCKEIIYLEFTIGSHYINKLVFDPMWYWINIKDKFL